MTGTEQGRLRATTEFVNADKYLLKREIEGTIPAGLKHFRFKSGSEFSYIKSYILPYIIPLWASALSRPMDDQLVLEDSIKHPFDEYFFVDLVLNDRINEKEAAAIYIYKAIQYKQITGLNVHICLVHEDYQGYGLMNKLIRSSIDTTQAQFLTLHTQNQHMVQAVRSFCPKGFLFPIDGIPPLGIRQMADSIEKESNKPKYDENVMVIRGMFGAGTPLYGDRKERIGNHTDIRTFFLNNVNFQKGDGVLIIGLIPPTFKQA
ncbi:MAG: hypothetical protein AAB656_01835 [Patescibacteria group bacterium]